MFPKNDLEKKLNVQIATSAVMDSEIALWMQMYMNQPPWLGGEQHTNCLNLPAVISEETARLILTEFTFQLDGSALAQAMQGWMGKFLTNLPVSTEMWCALGGIVFKPYPAGEDENGNPDHLETDVVWANRFYPTHFDSNGNVTGGVFLDVKREGDYVFTRIEYHRWYETMHYSVINKAYRSERIYQTSADTDVISCQRPFDMEVDLASVDGWQGIEPDVEMDDIPRPLFVYIRTPRANNVDPSSPLGVSVFSKAKGTIEQADIQYTRALWEYKATEAAINADESLFETDRDGKPVLPKGEDRLFRTFEFEGEKKGYIEAYAPTIRDTSIYNGLNQLLRKVELQCGLAYGVLSEVAEVDRTATEVKNSKQRSFVSINALQKALNAGLAEVVEVMKTLNHMYGIVEDGEVNITCTWGDGVLEDMDVEYQRRWTWVMAGKYKLESFYAWYFGCTEEDARKMIPAQPTYPPEE